MAKVINITNGTGTAKLINDNYTVTANAVGYNNSSINPNNVNIVNGTNTYAFTISASGTLTLHVTEEGTSSGTPVVGATFVRTDSNGNTYGAPIVTDASGNAVFNNVPYSASNAPIIYFKQTSSDGNHEFEDEVQSTTLSTNTKTLQIKNEAGATRKINLTDANYANLPIANATITLTN